MVIRGLEGTITQPYPSKVRIWLAFFLAGSQFSLRYMYSIMQYLHFTIVFIQNHAAGSIVKHTLTSDRGGCAQDLNSGKTENSTCPQKKRGQVLFFSVLSFYNPARILQKSSLKEIRQVSVRISQTISQTQECLRGHSSMLQKRPTRD